MIKERPLTRGERRVIQGAAHCASFGLNFTTGRRARKADALKLVKRGLLEDGGLAVMVDGDGFALEPERYRQSYKLTEAGHAAHACLEREDEIAGIVRTVAVMTPADMTKTNLWFMEMKRRARKLKEPWAKILEAAAKLSPIGALFRRQRSRGRQ